MAAAAPAIVSGSKIAGRGKAMAFTWLPLATREVGKWVVCFPASMIEGSKVEEEIQSVTEYYLPQPQGMVGNLAGGECQGKHFGQKAQVVQRHRGKQRHGLF